MFALATVGASLALATAMTKVSLAESSPPSIAQGGGGGTTPADGSGVAVYRVYVTGRADTERLVAEVNNGGDLVEAHDFGRNFSWHERGAIQWHFDEAYAIHDLVAKHGREVLEAIAASVHSHGDMGQEVMRGVLPSSVLKGPC